MTDSPETWFEDAVRQKFRETSEVHLNLEQVIIVTTEDKLRLCLLNAVDRLDVKRKWWTPLSVFATLILALTTTEFQDRFAISATTWQAVFLILATVTLIWSVVAVWQATRIEVSVKSIASELKRQPQDMEA